LLNSSRFGKSLVKKPSFFLSGLSLNMSLYLLFSKYGCLPSLHLMNNLQPIRAIEKKPNVQKWNGRKVSWKGNSASHWTGNQLFALAAFVFAAAFVRFDERLADAHGRRKSESASQLLGSRDLNWSFNQLGHVASSSATDW
jgi:hypothetical protein